MDRRAKKNGVNAPAKSSKSARLDFVWQCRTIMGRLAVGGGVQTFKSVFGVARALGPVLYCGYLAYYFFDAGGSVQGIQDIGLGPTVLGLGAVGLLFCIPLVMKIVRMFRTPRAPGSGGSAPTHDGDDDDGGAAADAAIARYMARKAKEDASAKPSTNTVSPRPVQQSSGPARRPSFGRKG
jgi:hypothetical protein